MFSVKEIIFRHRLNYMLSKNTRINAKILTVIGVKSALKTRGTLNAEFYLHIYLLNTIQSTLSFINRNERLDRKFQPVLRKRRILSREIYFC